MTTLNDTRTLKRPVRIDLFSGVTNSQRWYFAQHLDGCLRLYNGADWVIYVW